MFVLLLNYETIFFIKFLNSICLCVYYFLAQKIVREMLTKRYDHNGLIKKLCDEDMSDVDITRIVADFVIAAGDTVCFIYLRMGMGKLEINPTNFNGLNIL